MANPGDQYCGQISVTDVDLQQQIGSEYGVVSLSPGPSYVSWSPVPSLPAHPPAKRMGFRKRRGSAAVQIRECQLPPSMPSSDLSGQQALIQGPSDTILSPLLLS